MSNTKKALSALMLSGKIKIILTIIMFIVISTFSFGTYGMLASITETNELIKNTPELSIPLIDSGMLFGIALISAFTGWLTMTIMLIYMENFLMHYNAMCVVPVKKEYGIKFCITRVSLIICCMYIPECALLTLNFIEYSAATVLATIFSLASYIALLSALYSLGLCLTARFGKSRKIIYIIVFYFGTPIIGMLKGFAYMFTIITENGIIPLIISIFILTAAVYTAIYAKKSAIRYLE